MAHNRHAERQFEPMGYHRIEMVTRDGDARLVLYVPLNARGQRDEGAPVPNLVSGSETSVDETYTGSIDEDGEITWDNYTYVSRTDLFDAPLRLGRQVVVPSFYYQGRQAVFVISDIYPAIEK